MTVEEPLPPELAASVNKPSAARVYDWYLGGGHHWAVDREFGRKIESILPDVKMYAIENRRFLNRAVRYCLRQGIRQFVDIGSGLPSAGNVHEIAEEEVPGEVSVVYVDNEPIAHGYSTMILDRKGDPRRHRALRADLLEHDDLWQQVLDTGVIDPEQPIALLVVAVLHFVKDTHEPYEHLAYYRDQLPAGSMLVLSHFSNEDVDAAGAEAHHALEEFYENTTNPGQLRGRAEFARFFGDFPLVEPGITYTPAWLPDSEDEFDGPPAAARIIAGVARKP